MIYFDDLLRDVIEVLFLLLMCAVPLFAYAALERYRLYRPEARPWFPLAVLLAWGSLVVGYFALIAWDVIRYGPAALYSEHEPNKYLFEGLVDAVGSALVLILHFTVNPNREFFPRPKT